MILNAVEMGEGRPLVLLHGLFGQARNFGALQRRLAAGGRRVIALDLPNHGSSPHVPVLDYRFMAQTVAEALAARGITQADVVGHSMGGKTAMMLALTMPQSIARLVIADIAPYAYPPRWTALIEAMRAVPAGASRAEADALLAPVEEDAGVRAFILTSRMPDGSGWRIGLEGIAASMAEIMGWSPPQGASFEGPTLFVTGELSTYVRPENRPAIREIFPAVRFVSIKDAGHWLHAEQPDRFAAVLESFFPAAA
ncbi:alpha/beta fold hydrolase [Roseomonas sp. SSH11]|uniref:Alpha/beta fold hydrolase n=1 Tax=Pararoseomonas baculiformis TaxID=2820812 RepID=A0ABS4ADX8_9PROT|nr:alpha/beta fold hydrolase [Pararoseomonas baculiformis]MBP0445199.1 alpha/beta fold hydrolase [Pararoseomonas baculiformis]